MTTINLLWPQWAELAAHLPWKTAEQRGFRSIWLVRKTGAFLANRYGRKKDSDLARLAWEMIFSTEGLREPWARPKWARPPHRIRYIRNFLVVLLLLGLASSARASDDETSPPEECDAPAGATSADDEEPGRLFRGLGFAMYAGYAGDFASTEYGLAHGAVELNPLFRHRGARAGAMVAAPFAVNYVTEELRKDGHPKLALWMRISLVALKGYVIAHNLREASR